MIGVIKKSLSFAILILLLGLFFTSKVNAQTFSSASDTLTTSRPSAAAPLALAQAANASQVTVTDLPGSLNNSALWLASDSAMLFPDTGQLTSFAIVASVSASSSNQRIVFFTAGITNAHHAGTTMITPVTSMHIIKITPSQPIPSGGKIIILFPGAGSNAASPSATGFTFNNEIAVPTDVTCYDATATTACGSGGGYLASNQLNSFTITTNVSIAAGHQVVINIGCTAANTSGVCTASAPRLVNPTKGTGSALGTGTADQWRIQLTTQNGSGTTLDTTKVIAATVESVQVQGVVEPYITFTISGVNTGTQINTNNSGCTGNTELTNTGIDATATFVNFGDIGAGFSIAAQNLTVTTNAFNGYAITATSSGKFINPITGFFFPDANIGNGLTNIDIPNPAVVTAGITSFGIHPCGSDVYTGVTWGTGTTGGTARYSNPYNAAAGTAYYANLAAHPNLPSAATTTTVEYEATAATTVPAGTYTTAFTYVATPIF